MFTDLVSFQQLDSDDVLELMALADQLKKLQHEGRPYQPLLGQTIAMIFEKPSLRTRVTFEVGIMQLGGHAVMLEGRLGEREAVPDVARNLNRWVDGIVARTFSHKAIEDMATYADIPVINALSDKLHPCQILADAQALREHKGDLSNLKLVFVGDGNNVCASWFEFAALLPLRVTLVCPKGYEVEKDILAFAQQHAKDRVAITHDLEDGLRDADAVYTDVWTSMGQEEESAKREKAFAPYQVNSRVMGLAKKDAVFMHCLPAKRGKEVTDDVLDGPQSIVLDQAENRLHAQKAVMVKLLSRGNHALCPKQRERRKANG